MTSNNLDINSAPNNSNQCERRDEKTDEKMSAANSDSSLKLAESCAPSQRSETNDEYHECQEHEIDNELELDGTFDSFTHETTDAVSSVMALGTSMSDLPKIDNFLSEALPICRAIDHAILYDLDTVWMDDHAPLPYPDSFDHKNMHLDRDHVHLPCAHNVWPTIKQSLKSLAVKLDSVEDMKNAISKFRGLNCHGLSTYVFIKGDSQEEVLRLFQKIAGLAAELPMVCTCSIPLLRRQVDSKVSMSQKQAACLLANAFFCTYPPLWKNSRLAPLTFAGLFKHQPEAREASQFAKLDCILNYFRRVFESMPNGTITFHRKVLKKKDLPKWSKSEAKILEKLRVSSQGRMEEDGRNMMCVDFANKFVGGGVLGRGCVQEEIMFLLCPELIISRLLAEELDDNETLVVKGFERFNVAHGYGRKFTWGGNYVDTSPRDKWCRRATEVLVMDALVLKESTVYEQLLKKCMKRELNKAYCGFHDSTPDVSTIVTGNWGCGAFGGDPLVKFLIQLMAASLAQRPMFYLTYHDVQQALEINEIHEKLLKSDCTVGQLYRSLEKAADKYGQQLTAAHIYSLITQRPLPHNIHDTHTASCMDTLSCIVQ